MDNPPHDFRAVPAADTPSPSQLQIPSSASVSNTQLATLLTDAYRENENLRKELTSARKRAERAERIAQIVGSDPTGSPGASATTPTAGSTNGGSAISAPLDLQQLQQKHTETVKKLIDDCDEQVRSALAARDESEARRRVAQDAWEQLDRYIVELEFRAKDARSAYSSRLSSANVASSSLSLPLIPSPTTILSASVSSPSSANPTQYPGSAMGPPGAVPSYRSSRHSSSRAGSAIFPVLPLHPNPNPSSTTHTPSTRRPRSPSMDTYVANQPPTKRSRANADDQRGRESRTSYSEPYLGVQHDYQDPLRQRRQSSLQGHPEARIIDRNYGSYLAHANPGYSQHPRRTSHSRSGSRSSASSLDVDEMLLRATTGGEEHGAEPNINGARYYDHPPQQQIAPSGRRRDGESPRPPGGSGVVPATNHYPSTAATYPANQSAPGSMRNVHGSQGQVYTTHVFAPVVTGAPTKKSKFPNTALNAGAGVPGTSLDNSQGSSAPTAPFAATNAQGQRICRQCGMVGRYKEGKCVEKWGPGPMGPGTVCDRCRKKMKRVERRGTLENQQLQNAAALQQHFQPRNTSHIQTPSQGTIQRSDTLITNQGSLGPSSFNQSKTEEEDGSHQHASQRTSTNNQASSPKKSSRHAPTPPAIAALREQDDDEDNEDPEQLPTSNVGRGLGRLGRTAHTTTAHSRSNSRNGRGNGNVAPAKKSSLSTTSRPSVSPHTGDVDVDEMDADADADADAEADADIMGAAESTKSVEMDGEGDADADADAELQEAVDAAEASSSSHGGDRSWLKTET